MNVFFVLALFTCAGWLFFVLAFSLMIAINYIFEIWWGKYFGYKE